MSTSQFQKDLEKLDRRLRNKILKAAMKEALKPLASAIKSDAPTDTGELKSSIKVKPGKRKKDQIIMEVNISTPSDSPHAARVEFGTKDQPAQPFIRNNVRSMRDQVIEDFKDRLDEGLSNL